MTIDSTTEFYLLLASVAGTYLLIFIGAIRARLRPLPRVENVSEAFAILEKSLKAAFPDLPQGFTWEEAMRKLKATNYEIDWSEIEEALNRYQAFRYGKVEFSKKINTQQVLRLAVNLSRK